MRLSLCVLLLICFVAPAIAADEVRFVRVWPGWRDADSFERISEYFTGREATGRRIIRRTHPSERAGFYYLARVTNPAGALPQAVFTLSLVAPTSPEVKTYQFPVALAAGTSVYELGLTGSDWPDRDAHPVAWQLELKANDGHVLATEQSFLWAKPAK